MYAMTQPDDGRNAPFPNTATAPVDVLPAVEVRASTLECGQRIIVNIDGYTTVLRITALWAIPGEWGDEVKIRCAEFPYPFLLEARTQVAVLDEQQ
jgi:hypothetical protein